MSLNIYFQTDLFDSNRGMADYFAKALTEKGVLVSRPQEEDFMFYFDSTIDGETVTFYMGKNDEELTPPLWQIWPEQKISLFKRLLGRENRVPEEKAKILLEEITIQIDGVQGLEWGK